MNEMTRVKHRFRSLTIVVKSEFFEKIRKIIDQTVIRFRWFF